MVGMNIYLPNFSRRATLIIVGGISSALLIYWLTLNMLVDKNAIRDRVVAIIEKASYTVEVQGTSLSVFPLPKVTLKRFAVNNPSEASESYFFETSSIEIHLDLFSLMSGHPSVRHITLVRPSLSLERFSQTETNWNAVLSIFDQNQQFERARVFIERGSIYYLDSQDGREETVTDIQGQFFLEASQGIEANLGFKAYDRQGRFTMRSRSGQLVSLKQFQVNSETQLRFDNEFMDFNGTISRQPSKAVIFDGVLKAEAQKSRFWFERFSVSKAKEGAFTTLPENLPLRLEATLDTHIEKGRISIKELTLGDTSGTAEIGWNDRNNIADAEAQFSFSHLNADELLAGEEGNINAFFTLFLPKEVEGVFSANIKKLTFQKAPFADVQVTSSLGQSELNLNQVRATLPGNTKVFLFGIMKRDSRNMINFDGSMEMLGENAAQFMQDSGFERINLVPQAHSKFRARANLFVSNDRATISELRFQGGDFYMVGGVNVNAGGNHDIETTLRFRNVRLEPLAAFFAPLMAKRAPTDVEMLNRRLPWLSNIKRSTVLNLLFDDFAFGDRKGVRSQFIVSIRKDQVAFQKIDLNFEKSHVKGTALFDQTGEIPRIEANLNLSEYNLNSLMGSSVIKHPVPRGNILPVWSSEPFETSFLRGYNSKLALHIDKAEHQSFVIENLDLVGESKNGDWRFETLAGDIWGGQFSANANLDVTSVTSLSTAFQMSNIQVEEALKSLAGFEGVRGRASISSELSSSGVSPSDFAKNASGTVAFSGRDIVIRGFDLASLVQTIPAVRSVADVVNTVRIATLQGASSFSIVDGGFYFSQGTVGTQGITFRSRHAIGSFGGTIDLMRWMLNAAIQFKLISITAEEYPMVTVLFTDSMDNPALDIDTRSLEAWVARQKLLQ
jgi:hypothetical protein